MNTPTPDPEEVRRAHMGRRVPDAARVPPPVAPVSATQGDSTDAPADDEGSVDWAELARRAHWGNLFNPRMWLWAGVTAFLFGIPVAVVAPGPAVSVVVGLVFFAALLGTTLLESHCPECGKAIRVGYGRCRDCGWTVAG